MILVTGASGFVCKAVVHGLVADGQAVVGLVPVFQYRRYFLSDVSVCETNRGT